MSTAQITVIVPVYNEENNLEPLYKRLSDVLQLLNVTYNILFIDDGSTDNSKQTILALSSKDKNVQYINLSRNFGHQIAVSAGLRYVDAECIVIIDADLQDPPELITKLYETYTKGYDVVYAKRQKRKGESFLKKMTAKIYYRLLKRIVKFEIPLDAGDFRLISKRVVNEINKMPEKSKYLRGQIAWIGFKQTNVYYERNSRNDGKSGYSYNKMFRLALDGITGFSNKPLTFVSRLGLLISIVSFCTIFYAIFSHFVLKHTIDGWTSLIISVSFLGGIQLLSIGIIGEYISRINKNTIDRPLFVVESSNIILTKDN